jgi:hypothetical protein
MDLIEEHLLRRPLLRPPGLDAALQGAELAVGEAAGEALLQVEEQRPGLQAGLSWSCSAITGRSSAKASGGRRVAP